MQRAFLRNGQGLMPVAFRIAGLVAAVVIFGAAALQAAQVAPAAPGEDPMLKGLRDRGLKTLLEAYLKQKGVGATGVETPGGAAGVVGGKVEMARLKVEQAKGADNLGAREALFQEARKFYEEAANDSAKAIDAIPPDKQGERNRQRMQLLKLRLELVDVIFQKWLKRELDILEVSDRRSGERDHAAGLLRACADQSKAIRRRPRPGVPTVAISVGCLGRGIEVI